MVRRSSARLAVDADRGAGRVGVDQQRLHASRRQPPLDAPHGGAHRGPVPGLGHLAKVVLVALQRPRPLLQLLAALGHVVVDGSVRLDPVGGVELHDGVAEPAGPVELAALVEVRPRLGDFVGGAGGRREEQRQGGAGDEEWSDHLKGSALSVSAGR